METTAKGFPLPAEFACSEELSNAPSAFHIQFNRCLYLGSFMDMSKKKAQTKGRRSNTKEMAGKDC